MKRQVAIVGPTPEFLRWSIRWNCAMREDTEISSVDQTEKRLRAVRAAGLAHSEGRVFDGIAIHQDTLRGKHWSPKGFRLSEAFEPWGGQDHVQQLCADCPANAPALQSNRVPLAGCHGWLRRDQLGSAFDRQLEIAWNRLSDSEVSDSEVSDSEVSDSEVSDSEVSDSETIELTFMKTRPRWYGLWAAGHLLPPQIELVYRLFEQVADQCDNQNLYNFCQVARLCVTNCLTMDVELMPPGNSDGLVWTISPHCDVCHAPRAPSESRCPACEKTGAGHPEVKRKVLGLRPYIDLSVLIPPPTVGDFVESCQKRHSKFDASSK